MMKENKIQTIGATVKGMLAIGRKIRAVELTSVDS